MTENYYRDALSCVSEDDIQICRHYALARRVTIQRVGLPGIHTYV